MNKKKKFHIVVMIPVIAVLIILGVVTFILIAGSAKQEPPTAFATAVPVEQHAQ